MNETKGMESLNGFSENAFHSVVHDSAAHLDNPAAETLTVIPSKSPYRNDLLPPDSIRPLKILFITPKGKKEEDTS
jgi:hypothetical protein